MPQSLAKVYCHIVFSTKHGKKLINDEIQKDFHSYCIGTLSNIGSYTNEVYANPDHVHILCTLPRTITIAKLLQTVKTSTSKWIKNQGVTNFKWQDGYAIFSVSSSKVEVVSNYIINQKEILLKTNINHVCK